MLKIAIISLICLILSIILKQKSPEFAMLVSVAGGLTIVLICYDYLLELISYYSSLAINVGIDNDIIKIALKIIAVGFLTEFVSGLATDFGNSTIASKVVFGGKVVICVITLPVVKDLVALLFSFY